MKVRRVCLDRRRKAFDLQIARRHLRLPFAKAKPRPTLADPVDRTDADHLRDGLLYALTVEAQKRVEASALSRRENYGKSIDQFVRSKAA